MRIRTRQTPNNSYWKAVSYHFQRSEYWQPSNSGRVYTSYESDEYIQDVDPTEASNRQSHLGALSIWTAYNPVTHIKNRAALYGGKVEYSYSPPAPSCNLELSGAVCYKPPAVSFSPSWGGLLDELAASLAGRTNNANMLLVSLKELGQTVAMIRNPFSLLKPSFRKKAQRLTASTLAKKSANVWLEYLYGWKSFYSDLNSFAKSCGKAVIDLQKQEMEGAMSRYSATQAVTGMHPNAFAGLYISDEATWQNQLSRSFEDLYPGNALRISNIRYTKVARVSCWAIDRAMTPANKLRAALSNFDLTTWQSLRDVLWEGIPFSFVVDWFIDTRAIWSPLNRVAITQLSQRLLGYSTKYTVEYYAQQWAGKYWPFIYQGGDGLWEYLIPTAVSKRTFDPTSPGVYTEYTRVAGAPPGNTFSSPLLNAGLSLTQCASGLALIAQRMF